MAIRAIARSASHGSTVTRVTGHSHGEIDWAAAVGRLRARDELLRAEQRELAGRLVHPQTRVVVDVGCGAGGMGAAFAEALSATGGTVVLVDSSPELVEAAAGYTRAEAGRRVEVRAVQADADSDGLFDLVPRADLVFASLVVHHLPDQQRGLNRLAGLLNPGGWLAVVEGGLQQRHLPWDVGVGEPGLEGRLAAAWDEWFRGMRAGIEGSVRMPVGWNVALAEAGLVDLRTFSHLIDKPAPSNDQVREAAVQRLSWLREAGETWIDAPDLRALDQLLDPDSEQYLGHRDDVFLLGADTVYLGRDPRAGRPAGPAVSPDRRT